MLGHIMPGVDCLSTEITGVKLSKCNSVVLTRRSRRTIMQTIPKAVSQRLVSPICSKILCQTCTNLVPETLSPRISFTWLVAMIIDAADVKPTDTGPDIKSSKNPNIVEKVNNNLTSHILKIT